MGFEINKLKKLSFRGSSGNTVNSEEEGALGPSEIIWLAVVLFLYQPEVERTYVFKNSFFISSVW